MEELTFYGSSEEFDKYYKQFGKDKSFLVDKNIYLDIFETKLNEKKIEENKKGTIIQKRLGELEEYFEEQKRNINIYFGSINFYDDIDIKYNHCNMDIETINELNENKNQLLQKLYEYYENKKKTKIQDWERQIIRAKYKSKCQCQGELKCKNGHKLGDEGIGCNKCDDLLYWVDGPSHYCICIGCQKVSKLNGLECPICKAETYCEPKFIDYIP